MINSMIYNGQEVQTHIHNGVEVFSGIHGKYVVENGVLNTDFASGEISTTSKCAGNTTGTSSQVALTLIDKLVGKPMTLTFRGYTTTSIYNKDVERYAYVECDGVRVATVDLLTQYQANKDETITVNFTPTVNAIHIGTYVRRTSDSGQSTQTDTQTAEIINLQVVNSVITITAQPVNQTVAVDNYATFTVEAVGNNLSYQWQYKVGSDAWKNSGMTGYNTNRITVQGTTARNGYQYRCVITDANGNQIISNPANLTVRS